MSKKFYKCTNLKHPESAYIIVYEDGRVVCNYTSKWQATTVLAGSYNDYFKTIKGAKVSISRYLGFKTKWEEFIKEE